MIFLLKVKEIKGDDVVSEVIYGGKLKSRKGINLPFTKVSAPCLTEKDLKDLEFGLLISKSRSSIISPLSNPLTLTSGCPTRFNSSIASQESKVMLRIRKSL